MLDQLTRLFGRLHMVFLHVPIGVIAAIAVCEGLAIARRRPFDRDARTALAILACISGVAAAGAGWVLANEPGHGGQPLTLHRWLGVSFAASMTLMLAGALTKQRRAYAAGLLVSLALAGPVGHLGGSMTHGPGYLTAPFRPTTGTPIPDDQARAGPGMAVYDAMIAPIFAGSCVSCHGPSKQRGGLALHTAEAFRQGGDSGPAFIPGDSEHSEIVWRLTLPPDDEDHMPPEDEPQPTPAQIAAIVRWIDQGASFESPQTP